MFPEIMTLTVVGVLLFLCMVYEAADNLAKQPMRSPKNLWEKAAAKLFGSNDTLDS